MPDDAHHPVARIADDAGADDFRAAFLAGLSHAPKSVPCRFLYDEAGAHLFERICRQPEYYLTRAETKLLRAHAGDIAAAAGPDAALIELGSGAGVKTRILLERMGRLAVYAPIDICAAQLAATAAALAREYPGLAVTPLHADYAAPPPLPRAKGRSVAFFPGSTIGNLDDAHARALLAQWRGLLGPDGMMILGADLKKDAHILEAAYDDAAGVTRAFIKNILLRANRQLGAGFDPDDFEYRADYEAGAGRVAMRLVARRSLDINVAGRRVHFAPGETLHVENSRKYAEDDLAALAGAAGWRVAQFLAGPDRAFAVCVLEAARR